MSAKPEVKCEECGDNCNRQCVSSCNFLLKGTGWASQEARVKKSMLEKNSKMVGKMSDREAANQGVKKLSDVNSSRASL
jgi:predicted nucleic acid-binding Zn ribbon protein